jgi:predicted nucleic acid-binding protein
MNQWQRRRGKIQIQKLTNAEVIGWAQELIALRNTKAIVSPVALEFLAGARTGEKELIRAFLGEFEIVDKGRIEETDWDRAYQYAERVPRDGRPRGAVDCLIRAIAERLSYEVDTADEGMPDSMPPRRYRKLPPTRSRDRRRRKP